MFGPAPDLLVGCGLISITVLGAYLFAGAPLNQAEPLGFVAILLLVISQPHYGGTLVRIYDSSQTIQQYRFFSIYLSSLILAWFVSSLFVPMLGVWLVTLYLTWSPWHYTGQNYGLTVMFLRRRGIEIDAKTRRYLYASFILSFGVTLLINHAAAGPGFAALTYLQTDIKFQSLAFPPMVVFLLYWSLIIAYGLCLGVSSYRLLRLGPLRTIAPAFLIMSLQIGWFLIPYSLTYQYAVRGESIEPWLSFSYLNLVAVGHAAQYLWITNYYAKKSSDWSGNWVYWPKVIFAGSAIWMLPAMLGAPIAYGHIGLVGFSALVAAAVNIHHFMLDGAIWKLRSGPIADILIRNRSAASAIPATATNGRFRKLAWSLCGVLCVVSVGTSVLGNVVLPEAVERGELGVASRILDVLQTTGNDRAAWRMRIAEQLSAAGQRDDAKLQYVQAATAEPFSAKPLLAIASSLSSGDDRSAAMVWYQRAVQADPNSADARFFLGQEYLIAGKDLDLAVRHLEIAGQLKPTARRWKRVLAKARRLRDEPIAVSN